MEVFKNLPLPQSTYIAEYVWIDGFYKMRSKGRTMFKPVADATELPEWNYDGSSTGQAPGQDSEVILKPQAIFKDPFRLGDNILVLCDCYTPGGEPIPTNQRYSCDRVMTIAGAHEPWFGIEQEYFMFDPKTGKPLGFPADGEPPAQGPYYCGVGAGNVFGRDICDAHYKACLYAGINVSGINGEVAPGQWEFQVGPCTGIAEGDQLWMARYILERIAEIAQVSIVYDPKPVKGDWNGSGGHTNYSTKEMREDGGYEKHIIPALEALALKHQEHIAAYGEGNADRLTGAHETASIETFKWGQADRGASCRVGNQTVKEGKGYFEDRRPAANLDPYVVTKMIVSTTLGVDI
mmetsp:Transcript_15765/g.31719  ORF Transcript_15765/g.31719 Transcript_15765/m.31719 type:complete len:350 (-) Transcript_15765:309-1358(-)|eukprot:CAMPEP_0184679404 /NCGR_PEP_ID=MMETSP0312-20130426/2235_1 /TAXON_ID=31354 /ORGANISM="Compsopogon coeruleus, Strain SAG 36.94" /LENGTH=349 /DNA_ID=CAMNT_0027128821 /DNA_START=60 /DNA_END=1109 /DNA_ORIENTATION=-